jgi:uncharacterized protein (TIGR02266 family)
LSAKHGVPRPVQPRAERVQINHEFASVEAFINEYVANISHSGVFIRSKDPLPVGTRVALKFTVIMDELEVIEGVGEVVRRSTRPPGMGVLFVELSTYSQDLIAKLITQRTRKGAAAKDRSLTVRLAPPPPPRPHKAAKR